MQESLRYFFANVYTASDGVEALNILKSKRIDTIFSDYEMPNMNGYEMIKEIRSFDTKIPITIFSNHDDKEKLQKCIPLGLSGYLFKPLRFEDFKNYMTELEKKFKDSGMFQYRFGESHIFDIQNFILIEGKKSYQLTKLEWEFLKFLADLNGKVATFELIFDNLEEFEPTASSIADLVYRIKKKYDFSYIKNIKDIGYIVVTNS